MGSAARTRVLYTPAWSLPAVTDWLGTEVDYRPQADGDLGRRMERAFATCFDEGFARVVVIGSDLPDLSADLLTEALALLDSHPVVLGPARDGGYWLLGLREPAPYLFEDVPWSTPEVLSVTLARLRERGLEPALLPTLADLDEAADLPPGW
jgi:uncharacterized protein